MFYSSRRRSYAVSSRRHNVVPCCGVSDISSTNASTRLNSIFFAAIVTQQLLFLPFSCPTLPRTLFPRFPPSTLSFLRRVILEAVFFYLVHIFRSPKSRFQIVLDMSSFRSRENSSFHKFLHLLSEVVFFQLDNTFRQLDFGGRKIAT